MQPVNLAGQPAKPSFWTRGLLFLTYFVAIQIVPMVLVLIRKTAMDQILIRSGLAILYLLGYIVIIVALVYSLKRVMNRSFWHWLSRRDALILVGSFLGFLIAEIGLNLLNQQFFGQSQTANNQAILSLLTSDRWIFYLLMFSGIILSPIVEELLFRGYLINAFFKPQQTWLPIIFSGVVFSLAHLSTNIVSFLIYAVLGMILATIYRRTENLCTSIGLHMLNNLLAMSMMAVMIH